MFPTFWENIKVLSFNSFAISIIRKNSEQINLFDYTKRSFFVRTSLRALAFFIRFGFRKHVDRHNLLGGEKAEKSKANVRRTKKGGAAARGSRCGFAPGWHFCIYVFMRFTLSPALAPARMIKNKHAAILRDSTTAARANKKNGQCCEDAIIRAINSP